MGRARSVVAPAAAAVAGVAVGYLGERALLRRRLTAPHPPGPPLGSIPGERTQLRGPDGVRLVVECYGPPDAPQIVLSHGWVCTGRVWHEQVRALSDRYRLITYDQPGHGRSSGPRSHTYDLDLFGDALATVIREVTAPGPLVLAGHSLGGMTILNYARRHAGAFGDRVRRALLLSTTSAAAVDDVRFGFGIHAVARLERVIRTAAKRGWPPPPLVGSVYRASSDLSFLLTRFFALADDADPRYVDFTEQLLLDSDFEMITGAMLPILTLDEDESLTCLTVPTLVAAGTADRLTPFALSRRMADRCAHADLVTLDGIGHMTPLEAHTTVSSLLDDLATQTQREAA